MRKGTPVLVDGEHSCYGVWKVVEDRGEWVTIEFIEESGKANLSRCKRDRLTPLVGSVDAG